MVRGRSTERIRTGLFVLIGVALCTAVWFQRNTLGDAVAQLRSMPATAIIALVALGVGERVLRADTLRRLLGQVSFGRALTIHDVGTAVTKGVPLGGPIATGRWCCDRRRWVTGSPAGCALPRRGLAVVVPPGGCPTLRRNCCRSEPRCGSWRGGPVACCCGPQRRRPRAASSSTWRCEGSGVGDELDALEFARVFFVVNLLSSFVPVPGGVGVVEVGLAGALVAAGVAAPTALAGVVVYRLLTYVVPIVVGAVLYVVWRAGVRRRRAAPARSPVAVPVPS